MTHALAFMPNIDSISTAAYRSKLATIIRGMESDDSETSIEAASAFGSANVLRQASQLIMARLFKADTNPKATDIAPKTRVIVPSSCVSYQLASEVVWWHNSRLYYRMFDEGALTESEARRRELRDTYKRDKLTLTYEPPAKSEVVIVSLYSYDRIREQVGRILARGATVAAVITLIDTRPMRMHSHELRTWGEEIKHLSFFHAPKLFTRT